ncbi:hypothetical protein EJ07DRAFT_156999 [Lizonia empirigonia]|nr:hypothetical protein EJ07DRAFT_156999 [Lizonia empirigonia]
MEATEYFERTLFYDRSPAADEYYEGSADQIFERDPSKTKIAVLVQSCNDPTRYDGKVKGELLGRLKDTEGAKSPGVKELVVGQDNVLQTGPDVQLMNSGEGYSASLEKRTPSAGRANSDDDDGWSLASRTSKASSTALPSAMDQRQAGSHPPSYPGLPRLEFINIAPNEIENFVKRTRNNFRVFYLRQRHSYSRLQITKEDFERLLASCHVFPRFNEYVIGFGSKTSEVEVGPPPLKFRPICTSHDKLYRGFGKFLLAQGGRLPLTAAECAYILRYIERTNRPGGKRPWSLRQFAVYHRFKSAPRSRCSTWILVGASARTEKRLDQYTRSVDDLIEINPIELHVIFLDTVIASWRPYLSYLTQMVSEQSGIASGVSICAENNEDNFVSITVDDHQQLKQIEDYVADLILCLDSTSDTLTTLNGMYEHYCENHHSSNRLDRVQHPSAHTDAIAVALAEQAREISYTRRKAESLLSKVQNTRTLISSLLERQSGHNIDQQIAALQQLERQGQDIAEKNSRDSSSMRVLTIITMVYLPCTIVSNFYSTQFVNQKELDNGITRLGYAQNAWLFFAISVPLTIFTFAVWYSWVHAGHMREQLAARLHPARKAEFP